MSKSTFPGLSVRTFSHPFDIASFESLARTPLISQFVNTLIKYVSEIPEFVNHYSGSVRVTSKNYSKIYDLMIDACRILDVSPPELFIKQNYVANAYALGLDNPSIILYSGLIDLLNEEEIQCVIAHELGHIKAKHIFYNLFVNFAKMIGSSFISSIFPTGAVYVTSGLTLLLLSYLRKCELTADRAALLVTQKPEIFVSMCMKLAGGITSDIDEAKTEEFLVQSKSLEGILNESSYASLLYWIKTIKNTHPLPVPRAAIANTFGNSKEFENILKGNYFKQPLKTCNNCKNETSILNKICPHCFAKFEKTFIKDVIYCNCCDYVVNKKDFDVSKMKFCGNCGADLFGDRNLFNRFDWV